MPVERLVAPYLDVAIIGPYLDSILSLGLGNVQVDFGDSCRSRHALGKRGYCSYKFSRIVAMRQVHAHA